MGRDKGGVPSDEQDKISHYFSAFSSSLREASESGDEEAIKALDRAHTIWKGQYYDIAGAITIAAAEKLAHADAHETEDDRHTVRYMFERIASVKATVERICTNHISSISDNPDIEIG